LWDIYFPSYISLLLGGAFAFYVRRANYNILHGLLKSLSQTEYANKELETAVENLNLVNIALEDSVSELNERDDTIRKMVYKDELTGLMSKYAFVEKLEEALKNNVEHITIVHLDIDNFKNVNDAFGHNFGNLVLRELGDRIQGILQKKEKICRYGNDEFIILTEEDNKEEIIQLVNRIQKAINEVLIVDIHRIFLTSSIGIAVRTNQNETSENLLRYADISLHESKKKGKDTYTIYGERLEENFKDKISFQNHIRTGYKNKEFFLNYQPLVSAESKEIVGYEALIRWTNSELGNVSPFKLITEAEEMGLMVKLGEWIVRQGMAFAKELNQKQKQNQYVSINVSALQLIYGGFYDSMVSIVREINIPPETICFEVTETALIEDIDDAIGIVKQLSDYGFKIALDDFGTGYSSLNYLKSFPIDVLKVDKSFVDHITQSSYDKCLVDAIIKIAKERAFSVIAEGVETKEQFDLLYEMGCDIIQGYLFSKPLMHEEAINTSDNKYIL
jgi:diguanylate cyclase (GGDEF)-like protein